VNHAKREAISNWLMLLAAPILLLSLFLTWSHQFSARFLIVFGRGPALAGVPRDPTAWQVYSAADVLLALLAAALLALALRGSHAGRVGVLIAVAVALAFVIHALAVPPTNGADVFEPSLPRGFSDHPTSGAGEVVALIALVLGAGGVLLSFTAE
jgi:hypothetical protein